MNLKTFFLFAAALFATGAAAWIPAFAGMTEMAHAAELPPAQEFRLDNGLQVLVIEDHKIPAVTQMVWYHIGGADEQHGKYGLAHYLEHLMFKATDNLQSGEFSKLIAWYGGNDNAFTTADYTAYHQTIPKEHLPLVMLLESDRMRGLHLDEQTALKERDVILEERSMRVDNQPLSLLAEKMNTALFGENHPYGIPVIGWRKDIEQLTYKDAQEFYSRYYAPNNATLVVAGDVTAEEVKAMAEKYYGPIPANTELAEDKRTILHAAITVPTPATPVVLKDNRVEQPEWVRYYLAPSVRSGEDAKFAMPLVLVAQVLGGGETSRLYQELVVKQGIATSANTWYDEEALGPSAFRLYITPKPGVTFDTIEKAVAATIAEFLKHGPGKQELQRARNLLRAQAVYAQDNLEGMARIYGEAAATGLDKEYITQWVNNVLKVTDAEMLVAARHIFTDKPRYATGHLMRGDK